MKKLSYVTINDTSFIPGYNTHQMINAFRESFNWSGISEKSQKQIENNLFCFGYISTDQVALILQENGDITKAQYELGMKKLNEAKAKAKLNAMYGIKEG